MASVKKVRQNSQLPLQAPHQPQKELQNRPYSQNIAIQEPALINAKNNHNKSFKSIFTFKNKHSQSACNSQKTLRKRLPNTLQSPSSNLHELNRIINENLSGSKKVQPSEVCSSQANKEQNDLRTTRSQDRNVFQSLHQNLPPNQSQELLQYPSVTPRLFQKQKELRQPIEKHIKYNKENRGIDFKPFQQQMFSPSTKLESKVHIVKQTPTPQVQKEVDETIESMQMEVDENVGHQRLPYAGIQAQNQITRPLQDKRQSNEHTSSRCMTRAGEDFPRLKLNFQNSQSFSSRTTFSSNTNDNPSNGLSSRLREQQASQNQTTKREHTLLFSQMPHQNTKAISRNRRRDDQGSENRSSSKSVCNTVKFSKKKVSIASIDLQNSKNISQMQRSSSSISAELQKKFVLVKNQKHQTSPQGSSGTLQPHITDSTRKKSCLEASSQSSKSFLKPPTIIHRRKKISKQENCREADDTCANACIEVKMEDITPSNNSAFSFTPQFYKPPNNTVKRLYVKRVTGKHFTESAVTGGPSNRSKSTK